MDAIELATDAVVLKGDDYTNAAKLNRIQNRFTSSQVRVIKAEKKLKKERHL